MLVTIPFHHRPRYVRSSGPRLALLDGRVSSTAEFGDGSDGSWVDLPKERVIFLYGKRNNKRDLIGSSKLYSDTQLT